MKPTTEESDRSQFVFFGGKGGVGKTTCAAVHALSLAARRRRVLVISTDPAHSLGDVLGRPLGARPRRVARGLDAAELDAPRAFARWLNTHRRALSDLLEHGTWLDRADIAALLDLTVPGVDELVGLVEIARLATARYDTLIVDTAPTGHTLRLLAAPDTVAAVAAMLDALQEEHRVIRQRFAGSAHPDAGDRLIALMTRQAEEIAALIRDPRRTSLHWVTLPEALSIAEADDALAALGARGIGVREIVVNRVLPPGDRCPLCDPRRAEERRVVARLRKTIGRGRRVRLVAASVAEPRGLAALRRIGAGRPITPPAVRTARQPDAAAVSPAAIPAFAGAELLFVGGKGGVGKTTVAASIALALARATPGAPVLLLSTDPAHSLGDVFDAAVGDNARRVPHAPTNLTVRELDAAAAFAAKRDAIQSALDTIGGADLTGLAPPGIDELFGMLSVVEARAEYRTIVVDTAPTGHALRLLEMPGAAREWLQTVLRMLLKYKSVVRPGPLAAEVVAASQSVRALMAVLRDPARARFVLVTRAAAVPRAETERLLERLRSLRLATTAIVVNARTLEPRRCRRCLATAAVEARELAALSRFTARARRGDCVIIQTPLVAPPPRGAATLERWSRTWTVSD